MTDGGTPELQVNVLKYVGIAQAASLAASSQMVKKAVATSAEVAAKCSSTLLQIQIITAQAKIDLIDLLSEMSDENELFTIFDLLDKEGSGLIDTYTLAEGLSSVGGDGAFVDILADAATFLDRVDADKDGRIKCSEFQKFLSIILSEANCTLHDVALLLVTHVVFPEVALRVPTAPVFEDRLDALFMLFDTNGDGQLEKKEVSCGFSKMTDDLDESTKIAWSALLLVGEENARPLSYQDFAQLILNIAAAAKIEFNEFADLATLSLCRTKENAPENLSYLFMGNELKNVLAEMEQVETVPGAELDAVQYGRMQRLFHLWDLDHNGYIDLSEMLFGMRKFQEAKNISMTVEECVSALLAFDTNDDAKLDVKEFAGFLVKFAASFNVSIQELIDFMVVTSALKDNNEAERDYIEAIGKKGTEAIMRRKGKRTFGTSLLKITA